MPRKTSRMHQQGSASRLRILEAALDIAAERGYDGTSIGAVTEATGLPASSIYWQFKNKDELLAEVLEFSYQRWRATGPDWSEHPEELELAEQVATRFSQAAYGFSEQPEFWRLGLMLALEQRVKETAARARYVEIRADTFALLASWWERVLSRDVPDLDPSIPTTLAQFQLAVMDGIFVSVRANPEWDREWLVKAAADGLSAEALRLVGRSS